MSDQTSDSRNGRVIALVIAGVGLAWIVVTALGSQYGWSNRVRALFDLAALAGFGWAIWMIYGMWRARQNNGD